MDRYHQDLGQSVQGVGPNPPGGRVRIGWVAVFLLGISYICSATTVQVGITGEILGCGYDDTFNGTNFQTISETYGPLTFQCDSTHSNTSSITSTAIFSNGSASVQVDASTNGSGAHALGDATFTDIVFISPPLGLSALDATFSVDAFYALSLDLPDDNAGGAAEVQLILPDYGLLRYQYQLTGGSSQGILTTGDLTLSNCPCTVEIDGIVSVNVSNGGSGHAVDPFTINLPEGWTYTLESESLASVPEPGNLVPVGTLLIAAGIYRRRRVRIGSTSSARFNCIP